MTNDWSKLTKKVLWTIIYLIHPYIQTRFHTCIHHNVLCPTFFVLHMSCQTHYYRTNHRLTTTLIEHFLKIYGFFVQKQKYLRALNYKTREQAFSMPHPRNSFGPLPRGYCKRKTLNLEKTTSSVLSVLSFIYGTNDCMTNDL